MPDPSTPAGRVACGDFYPFEHPTPYAYEGKDVTKMTARQMAKYEAMEKRDKDKEERLKKNAERKHHGLNSVQFETTSKLKSKLNRP
jgi:uncharacterized lipoprotein YehR (DUF1307 family)